VPISTPPGLEMHLRAAAMGWSSSTCIKRGEILPVEMGDGGKESRGPRLRGIPKLSPPIISDFATNSCRRPRARRSPFPDSYTVPFSEAEETKAREKDGSASGGRKCRWRQRGGSSSMGHVGLEVLWKKEGRPGEEDGSAASG
jgi:hypothetical protein